MSTVTVLSASLFLAAPPPPQSHEPAPSSDPATEVTLGATGWVGIGLIGIGTGAAVGGAVMLVDIRNNESAVPTEDGFDVITSRERVFPLRQSVPILVIGSLVGLTGIGLLSWELNRDKRQPRNVSLSPVLGGTLAGLSATGRF